MFKKKQACYIRTIQMKAFHSFCNESLLIMCKTPVP